jgi:hypothetical protein
MEPMRPPLSTGTVLALTALLAVVVVVGASVLVGATGLSWRLPRSSGSSGGGLSGSPTVYRNLTITYSPMYGDYVYSQTQLTVPANVVVVFTIVNYDPTSSALPSPSYALVSGTMNGREVVSYGTNETSVSGLSTTDVSHTFTMSDPYYQLNVPIPPAAPGGSPARVTFSMVFHFQGPYFSWGCDVYCGGPMMTRMYGSLAVVGT